MKKFYSISIPKPCHEDWTKMTPKDKGRFCDSCSKTVIDFTDMSSLEIQDFIDQNKHNSICGHIKQIQLDSINLRIPFQVFNQQQNSHKLFLLVLLIVMGTSLLSCTNKQDEIQKIDSVEVINSISKQVLNINNIEKICDTILAKFTNQKNIPLPMVVEGTIVVETIGNFEIIEENPIEIDSINVFEINALEDEIEVVGLLIPERKFNEPYSFFEVETPPEFINTPQNVSIQEKRDYFKNKITVFILENFNPSQGHLGLTGKQRIYAQFKIDTLGFVKDIKARAPHNIFEKEVIKVVSKLPQLIPARQKGKAVSIIYSLPIIFQAED